MKGKSIQTKINRACNNRNEGKSYLNHWPQTHRYLNVAFRNRMDKGERNQAEPKNLVSYKHRSGSEKRLRALQKSLKAAGDDPKQGKLFQAFKMYDGGDGDSGYVLLFK